MEAEARLIELREIDKEVEITNVNCYMEEEK